MGIHTLRQSRLNEITNRPYWTDLEEVRPINSKFIPLIKGLTKDGKPNVIGGTVEYTDYDGIPIYPVHFSYHESTGEVELGKHKLYDNKKSLGEEVYLESHLYSQVFKKHVAYRTYFSY